MVVFICIHMWQNINSNIPADSLGRGTGKPCDAIHGVAMSLARLGDLKTTA